AHDELAIELARGDFSAFRRSLHLDVPFGSIGRATTAIAAGLAEARDVAVLPDGRIVAAGFIDRTTASSVVVVRWLADGRLDPTFGTNGVVERSVTGGRARGAAVGIQSDGRIVVAGTLEKTTGDSAGVAMRFGTDGKVDSSFGANGLVSIGGAGQKRRFEALAVSALDDDVVLVGDAADASSGATAVLVARLDRSGAPHAGFGSSGVVRQAVAGGSAHGRGVAIGADGTVVAAGVLDRTDGRSEMLVLRLASDGRLDAAFGSSGQVRVDLGSGRASASSLALQADGAIVLAGRWDRDGLPAVLAAVRLGSSGVRDTAFGKAGRFTLDLANGDTFANAVAVDAKGRIFLAGGYREADGSGNVVTVALRRDGARLKSFAQGGVSVPTFTGASSAAWAVAIGADGKPVVAGSAGTDAARQAIVVRHVVG
ncbi:MAG: delta-60 repeat domain-containing protein, partial [Alphaproteobacteria bacterium]